MRFFTRSQRPVRKNHTACHRRIHRVGAKRLGVRIGDWLTVDQSRILLGEPLSDGLRGKRDRAILALLIGCGLRRAELVGLGMEDFQVREEHWVIADLIGKGKHIRTVPVPAWAKRAVDEWTAAADIIWWRDLPASKSAG